MNDNIRGLIERTTTVYSVGEALRYRRHQEQRWWSAAIPCGRDGMMVVGGLGEMPTEYRERLKAMETPNG